MARAATINGAPFSLRVRRFMLSGKFLRGSLAVFGFFVIWQVGSMGLLPFMHAIPTPITVGHAFWEFMHTAKYWQSWLDSTLRVTYGFVAAQLLGIPLGLGMGWNRSFKDFSYPLFELMRPIPPLAWVPVSILFWPTNETSIAFITFIGAFFTIVVNVLGGVGAIPRQLVNAAVSFGASPKQVFWRIVLPATIPSIVTGMMVGIGITWNVVIAAEMIAGNTGLGRLTWEAYLAGHTSGIIVGMISIGVAGYVSSMAVKMIGDWLMPWKKIF
ncbi:MAG: ABC transporter permease [Thermodesulfobacteriota bacterium]